MSIPRYLKKGLLLFLLFLLVLLSSSSLAHVIVGEAEFICVVLGSGGGPREDNVSGYMIWPKGATEEAIFFDPGVLTVGIRRADEMNNLWDFSPPTDTSLTREGWILQNAKAYLISHAHLDHIAAMVINSPEDSKKQIIGLPETLSHLQDHVFNWALWPNFGDRGVEPHLGKYTYIELEEGRITPIENTSLRVEAYELAHDGGTSTAFLLESRGYYLLLCGDTGPDQVQETKHLHRVWERIAPLIREERLLGILLEVSYTSDRPDHLLFGHLTPYWIMEELRQLAELVDPHHLEGALGSLTILITHIKPVFHQRANTRRTIAKELAELNDLGVTFIIPYQGQRVAF